MRKKMNSYVKYALWILGGMIIGGIFGAMSVSVLKDGLTSINVIAESILQTVRDWMLLEYLILLPSSIVIGEYCLRKVKKLYEKLNRAEEEEADLLDYEVGRFGAIGMTIKTCSSFLAILILATGYSFEYMESLSDKDAILWFLLPVVMFVVLIVYYGYWDIRLIKMIQKYEPKQQGDPSSVKFHEQWLASCDEAERELIYQSSYYSYQVVGKCLPFLMLAAMLMHLIWNTGIAAVFFVGLIWMILTVSYLRNSQKGKKEKLFR